MSKDSLNRLQGELVEHSASIMQAELQRLCQVPQEFLLQLIDEGVIEPELDIEGGSGVRYFSAIHIQRVKRANRLNKDLGVNVAGIALILDLLDRIESLERLNG